jgi:hypothetical protein
MIQWNATRCLGRGRPRPRVGNAAGAAGFKQPAALACIAVSRLSPAADAQKPEGLREI